jgi:hypothetical protein
VDKRACTTRHQVAPSKTKRSNSVLGTGHVECVVANVNAASTRAHQSAGLVVAIRSTHQPQTGTRVDVLCPSCPQDLTTHPRTRRPRHLQQATHCMYTQATGASLAAFAQF